VRRVRSQELGSVFDAVLGDGAQLDDDFVLKAQLLVRSKSSGAAASLEDELSSTYEACLRDVRFVLDDVLSKKPLEKADGIFVGDLEDLVKSTTNENKHSGIMIALEVPQTTGKQLAPLGSVSPEDMHVTLAYFPETSDGDTWDSLCSVVSGFAAKQAPFSGEVGGVGRFAASDSSDGKDVIVALVDSPELPDFRNRLLSQLGSLGSLMSRKHGYIPHVTLSYVSKEAPHPLVRAERLPTTFSSIVVASKNRRQAFLLGEKESSVPSLKKGDAASPDAWLKGASHPDTLFLASVGSRMSGTTDWCDDVLAAIVALSRLGLLVAGDEESISPNEKLLSEDEESIGSLAEISLDELRQPPLHVVVLLYCAAALMVAWHPEKLSYELSTGVVPDTKLGETCLSALRLRVMTSPEDGTLEVLRERLDELLSFLAEALNRANEGDPVVREVFVASTKSSDFVTVIEGAKRMFPTSPTVTTGEEDAA